MKGVHRLSLAAATLLLVVGPGCDERTTLAEIDEPVAARIDFVVEKHVGGSGNHFVCSPRIIENQKAEIHAGELKARLPGSWNSNDTAVLVGEPGGKRLAYRKGDEAWRPIWIGQKHLLVGSDGLLQSASEVDFSKTPALPEAAALIFTENPRDRATVVAELELAGKDAVRDLLVATRAASAKPADVWEDAYESLPPAAQKVVDAALARSLLEGKANASVLLRIARGRGLDNERERSAALRAAEGLGSEDELEAATLAAIAAQAARIDLTATARFACDRLRRAEAREVATLWWIVAAAGQRCDGVELPIDPAEACTSAWRCAKDGPADAPSCSSEELEPAVRKVLKGAAEAWRFPALDAETRMAVAIRTSSVPEAVRRANERRRYAIVQSGPGCELSAKPGVMCTCDREVLAEAACRAGDATEAAAGNCRFSIDDRARRIGGVKARRSGKVIAIENAGSLGCALVAGGRVQCWSDSARLRLPLDAQPDAPFARASVVEQRHRAEVTGLGDVTKVVSGSSGACALDREGTVWCIDGLATAPVRKLDDCVDVAQGLLHACAAGKDGKVLCWGSNNVGQIPGQPVSSQPHDTPAAIPDLGGVGLVRAAYMFTCALGEELRCWGNDPAGAPRLVPGSRGATLVDVWSGGGVFVNGRALRFFGRRTLEARDPIELPGVPTDLAVSSAGVAVLIGDRVWWLGAGKPEPKRLAAESVVALGRNDDAASPGFFFALDRDGALRLTKP